MKRFIILVLAFSALVLLKAEQKTETKQVCECKEGEANCPCLAQSEDNRPPPPKAQRALRSVVVSGQKPPVKKLVIKRRLHIKKAQVLKAKMVRTAQKVAKLDQIAKKAPPHMKRVVLRKKMQAIKRLRVLRRVLHNTHIKIRLLKKRILTAPLAVRSGLIAKKRLFKGKCAELLREIAAAESRVRVMKQKYRFLCVQKLKHKAVMAQKVHKQIKLRLTRVKLTISRTKMEIRVAEPAQRRVLVQKLKVLKKKFKKLAKAERTTRKTALILKTNVQKMQIRIDKQRVVVLKQKAKKMKRHMQKIVVKLQAIKQKVVTVQTALRNIPPKTPEAVKLKTKLLKLIKKTRFLSTTLVTLKQAFKPIKTSIQVQKKKVQLSVQLLKKEVRTDRCTQLQKKLQHELALAKELKMKFAQECKKAAKSAKAENLSKLQLIQTRIHKIQDRIEKTKAQISKVPLLFKARLVVKLKVLQKQMNFSKRRLNRVITKLETLKTRARVANPVERIKLQAQMARHEAKLKQVQKKLQIVTTKYTTLKTRYDHECSAKLEEQRRLTRAYMAELEGKLTNLGSQTDGYRRLIVLAKKEAAAKAKLAALRQRMMAEKNILLKKRIQAKIVATERKVAQIKQTKVEFVKKTKELRTAYEQKTQEMLTRERNAARLKQQQLKAKMALILQKKMAIRRAMIAAHDVNIKAALARQQAVEQQKLRLLRKKLSLAKARAVSVKLELKLRLKAITVEGKEAAMKQALLAKQEEEKLSKLQMLWESEAQEDLTIVLKNLQAEYAKKMAHLKKKLAQLVVERDNYTLHMGFQYRSEKSKRVLKTQKRFEAKIDALNRRLAQLKQDFAAYKLKAAKDLAVKEKLMSDKAMEKLKIKIGLLKRQLRQERERQAAALRAAQLTLKQSYIKEQSLLEQKILNTQSRIAALRADWMKRLSVLRSKLAQKTAKGDELAITLDSAKADAATQSKKYAKVQKAATLQGEAALAAQRKTYSVLISNSRGRLASIQSRFVKTKTDLEGQLQQAESERSVLTQRLNAQKKKYGKLMLSYKSLTATMSKQYDETLKVEKTKTEKLKAEYEKALKDCDGLFKQAQEESNVIRTKLDKKIEVLKSLREKKVRRAKMAVIIKTSEHEFAQHTKHIDKLEFERRKVCDIVGTPGPELRRMCQRLQNAINGLKWKDKDFMNKISNLRKEYDSI